jgi:pimeloyl-ACP methyl ester carboxylesterase
MSTKRILALAIAALVGSAVLAAPATAVPVKPTDYQSRSHWLSLPGKSVKQKKVAVFYVYPTAYSRAPGGPIYSAVDDPGMMQGAQVAFQRQATAFRTVGNVYAPYYRQIDAVYQLSQPFAQQKRNIAGIPSTDVFAAFKYFLKHFDHGRPFILVGHSQGSAVLANLLAKYMKAHPAVYARMIAAYVPGYPIQRSYLQQHPFLKYARGAGDTGVIVSWNTEAPTIAAPSPVVQPGAIAINPITWTRSQTEASAAQNPGSIELDPATGGTPVLNANGTIRRFRNVADARVDTAKGVVVCSTVDSSAPPYFRPGGFPMGVLHTFDYALYFFSVRANAANRAAHFFAQH